MDTQRSLGLKFLQADNACRNFRPNDLQTALFKHYRVSDHSYVMTPPKRLYEMSATDMNEAEKLRILEERIRAPSIWGKVPCGIRFEDLQDKRYEEAVKLVKKHFLPEEITYKSLKFTEDQEAVDEMVNQMRILMKDKMSIAAVKEGINKVVGVLIMRIQEKSAFSRTFSHVKLHYNEKYVNILNFYKAVEKPIDLFKEMSVKRYLKIYLLAFKSRYRHRGLGKEMIKAAMGLAAAANVPVISNIFTTSRGQQVALELGFEKFNEIYYIRYLKDGEIVFWDTGTGNYGAALMAYRIPDVDEPLEDLTKSVSSRFTFQLKSDAEVNENDDINQATASASQDDVTHKEEGENEEDN